jgi:hypothetical protein
MFHDGERHARNAGRHAWEKAAILKSNCPLHHD